MIEGCCCNSLEGMEKSESRHTKTGLSGGMEEQESSHTKTGLSGGDGGTRVKSYQNMTCLYCNSVELREPGLHDVSLL